MPVVRDVMKASYIAQKLVIRVSDSSRCRYVLVTIPRRLPWGVPIFGAGKQEGTIVKSRLLVGIDVDAFRVERST